MRVTLETEHNRIQTLCGRVEEALRGSPEPNPLFLTPVRDELAAMLTQHMNFKKAMIYEPLRHMVRPNRRSIVEQMEALCTGLYDDYRTHRAQWCSDRIMTEWSLYRAATLDLLDRLSCAIQLERVHIYPLLTTVCDGTHRAA